MKRSCRLGLFRVKQMVAASGIKQYAPTTASGSWRMCALSGACVRFYTRLYFSFSLIIDTQKVPIISIAPAAIIMWL